MTPSGPCRRRNRPSPVVTSSHTSQESRPLLAAIQPIRQRPFGVQVWRASSGLDTQRERRADPSPRGSDVLSVKGSTERLTNLLRGTHHGDCMSHAILPRAKDRPRTRLSRARTDSLVSP
jgi:hypothetical protein